MMYEPGSKALTRSSPGMSKILAVLLEDLKMSLSSLLERCQGHLKAEAILD